LLVFLNCLDGKCMWSYIAHLNTSAVLLIR
jgi:hypothetical protein